MAITVAELRDLAKKHGIVGYSKMKKAELMAVLEGKIEEKTVDVGKMDKELVKARKEADTIVKEEMKKWKAEFAKLQRRARVEGEDAVKKEAERLEKEAEKALKKAHKDADKAFDKAHKEIVKKYL